MKVDLKLPLRANTHQASIPLLSGPPVHPLSTLVFLSPKCFAICLSRPLPCAFSFPHPAASYTYAAAQCNFVTVLFTLAGPDGYDGRGPGAPCEQGLQSGLLAGPGASQWPCPSGSCHYCWLSHLSSALHTYQVCTNLQKLSLNSSKPRIKREMIALLFCMRDVLLMAPMSSIVLLHVV